MFRLKTVTQMDCPNQASSETYWCKMAANWKHWDNLSIVELRLTIILAVD